jgi:hypothetical protein
VDDGNLSVVRAMKWTSYKINKTDLENNYHHKNYIKIDGGA